MEASLAVYDEACRAVALAATVDEAKDLADKADAIRIYARKANNTKLELDAAEIRIRAERRLGQIIIEGKDAGRISIAGGRPRKDKSGCIPISQLGVHKDLSMRGQQLARMRDFDRAVGRWRGELEQSGLRPRSKITPQRLRSPRDKERDGGLKLLGGRKVSALAAGELRAVAVAALAEFKLLSAIIAFARPASALTVVGDIFSETDLRKFADEARMASEAEVGE